MGRSGEVESVRSHWVVERTENRSPYYRRTVDEPIRWYLIEAVANARADPFAKTDYDHKQRIASHFAGALAALRYQESITQDEESAWYRKMLLGLGYDLPEPPPSGVASFVYLGDPEKRPEPPDVSEPTNLVQTIRGSGRVIDFHGGKLRIERVEVFDDAVVIHWDVTPDLDIWQAFPVEAAELEVDLEEVADEWAVDELREKATRRMALLLRNSELTDDAGTTYRMAGSSRRGSWNVVAGSHADGHVVFRPAPTTGARRLKWTWLSTTLEIPLR